MRKTNCRITPGMMRACKATQQSKHVLIQIYFFCESILWAMAAIIWKTTAVPKTTRRNEGEIQSAKRQPDFLIPDHFFIYRGIASIRGACGRYFSALDVPVYDH
jgi:hypothetical protein